MAHLFNFLKRTMTTWRIGALSSYGHQVRTPGVRKEERRDQLARIAVLLLVSSLCCPLHAQSNTGAGNDYVSSATTNVTIETRVVIGAPIAVITKSMDVFTTGVPIRPVYIQAPSGLVAMLTIQCKGGAARLNLPDYVYNFSLTQTGPGGAWNTAVGVLNATDSTWLVTGLGIRFIQNISVSNDALSTLAYGKSTDNDIAGKATMTITLNWTLTLPDKGETFVLERTRRIFIVAPSYLSSISTFQGTVAAICLIGIFVLCCLGCLNTVAVSSLRRFSVHLERETRDQQECDQNRVFNPLWMPCAPTEPDFYSIDSSSNPLILMKRRKELKTKILRMSTPFSLMDRMMKARHVRSSPYVWVCCQCRCPCDPPAPRLRDSSSDDERPAVRKADALACCLSPGCNNENTPANKAAPTPELKNLSACCFSPGKALLDHKAAPNPKHCCMDRVAPPFCTCERCTTGQGQALLQMIDPEGSRPRDFLQQGSSLVQTPAQATLQQPQPQPQDVQKFPAEPGVYLRSQYDGQDGGLPGNRERNTISVGYAFIHHQLAPRHSINTNTYSTQGNDGDFGLEGKTPYPTLATKFLHSVGDSEVEDVIIPESDLEIGTELRSYETASDDLFSPDLGISEMSSAERECDSGTTSECFRSPLSDLYEDVLESCSPTYNSDARHFEDLPLIRMQKSL